MTRSLHDKVWRLREGSGAAGDEAAKLGVSDLIVSLLRRRGLSALADMDVFLSPGLRHLVRPGTIPGLAEAARVLALAVAEGRKLAVWGDYDVDGVTSTALVTEFFAARGIAVRPYIPDRMDEGYGLNVSGIEQLAAEGVTALLTVDCGITASAEVERARELGMTVVVSDHHLPGDTLPEAQAVCNPRLGDCACAHLAGVGVAFFLMAELNGMLPGEKCDMRRFLDLVALGTLADVVELSGQNRILVKNGLLLIKDAKRPGIYALKEASGYNPTGEIGASQVVFGLAPRINAAGRVGNAGTALALMLAQSVDEARPLAATLDRLNTERRAEEEAITENAMVQAGKQASRLGLVLYDPSWHPGVIGIVASRIAERHNRPTLILTREQDHLKGSGRSIPDFDLHRGLTDCADILLGFGGHRQAAGLSLLPENFDLLRERFHAAVLGQLGEELPPPLLELDAELPFSAVTFRLLKELELMQPFGMGNPEPLFLSPPVKVGGLRVFGGGKHVMLQLTDQAAGVTLKAKAWRMAEAFPSSLAGQTVRAAFTAKVSTYQDIPSIELTLKDLAIYR